VIAPESTLSSYLFGKEPLVLRQELLPCAERLPSCCQMPS
jgi:hypothetical protein